MIDTMETADAIARSLDKQNAGIASENEAMTDEAQSDQEALAVALTQLSELQRECKELRGRQSGLKVLLEMKSDEIRALMVERSEWERRAREALKAKHND